MYETKLFQNSSLKFLPEHFKHALAGIPNSSHYVIALSGGLDSMLLLEVAAPFLMSQGAHVKALHVNHGLSPYADNWADFCQVQCERFAIDCYVVSVKVKGGAGNLEQKSRDLRYEVFEKHVKDGAVLLMGHHMNDQVETVLMRLFRGSGPKGLAGIPRFRPVGEGYLYRPWLDVPRAELADMAKAMRLDWVEDESNQSQAFDRNFVRHSVIPLLESRWPGVVSRIDRSASWIADMTEQLSELLSEQLAPVFSSHYALGQAIDLSKLVELAEDRQMFLVRHWLESQDCGAPPENLFKRIWTEVIPSGAGAQAEVNWNGYSLRRFDGCLFVVQMNGEKQQLRDVSIPWKDLDKGLSVLFGDYHVRVTKVTADAGEKLAKDGVLLSLPGVQAAINLRSRRGGERICLSGSTMHRELKKLLQDERIPPWERNRIPILYYGDEIVLAGPSWASSGFEPKAGEDCLHVVMEHHKSESSLN